MEKRLEDVLNIAAHAEACAYMASRVTSVKLTEDLSWFVPEFLMIREENQRVWADVMSAQTGVEAEQLLRLYQDYVARELAREEELIRAPEVAIVFWRDRWSDDQRSQEASCTDPVQLAWLCASLEEEGAHEVSFHVYGRGRVVKGNSTGWWIACPCGRWWCARHGVPRRLPPSWEDRVIWDTGLWPVVPIVRGAKKWHIAPPHPKWGRRRPRPRLG